MLTFSIGRFISKILLLLSLGTYMRLQIPSDYQKNLLPMFQSNLSFGIKMWHSLARSWHQKGGRERLIGLVKEGPIFQAMQKEAPQHTELLIKSVESVEKLPSIKVQRDKSLLIVDSETKEILFKISDLDKIKIEKSTAPL